MLKSATDNGICTITLTRAAARNTLSSELIVVLLEQLEAITHDPAIKIVIIAAEGPAFCAGHDMKEIQRHLGDPDGGKAYFSTMFDRSSGLMAAIRNLRQPVIAQVQGAAVAAGCMMVASCDLAVAGAQARFGVNGIDSGFFCSTPGVALARNISAKKSMELLLTGQLMNAQQALETGLINQVCAPEALTSTTRKMAATIAAKATEVISLGKAVFHRQTALPVDEAYVVAGNAMVENLMMADAKEGIAAFLEKRPARWIDQE